MVGIERRYLRECIQGLCNARFELLRLRCKEAVGHIRWYGKADSLRLDAIPEIVIHETLCKKFDPHLLLITEEMGSSVKLRGTEEEVVCFSDPMDRSKTFWDFLVKNEIMCKGSLKELFYKEDIVSLWEEQCGGDIECSGPYGSITAIRHHNILFNTMINYITGNVYIASEDGIGSIDRNDVFRNPDKNEVKRSADLLESINKISFGSNIPSIVEEERKFIAYVYRAEKKYEDI